MDARFYFQKLIIFTFLIVMNSSCAYRVEKTANDSSVVEESVRKGNYGYVEVNRNIFQTKCLSCHKDKAPTLNSFAEIKTALPRINKAVFEDKTMPPNGMSKVQLALLKKWIADGAPEMVSNPSPDPTSTIAPQPGRPVLWTQFKQQVFTNQCLNCHFTGNKDGISDYSDINVLRSTIPTAMYLTLVTKQMPPPPARLAPEESDAFAHWIIDGMRDDNGTPAPPPPSSNAGT